MVDYAGLTPPQIGTLDIGLPRPDTAPAMPAVPTGPQLGLNPQQEKVAELMHRANEAEARGQKRTAQKLRREAASLRVFEDGALHDKPPVIQNAPVPSYLEQVTDPGEGLVDVPDVVAKAWGGLKDYNQRRMDAEEQQKFMAAEDYIMNQEWEDQPQSFAAPEEINPFDPNNDPLNAPYPEEKPPVNDSGETTPGSTAAVTTRSGGTTGMTPAGEDTDLFEGVFSGGGFGKLKENWANMDQDRKDNIYKMLMTMGGTLMTTPGNFGVGLGTAMGEGVKAFTEYEEADDLMDMKRQKHEMDMMNAGLKYDAAMAQYKMAQQVLNDPNATQARKDAARAEMLRTKAMLEAYERGDFSFGQAPGKPTRLQEGLALIQQYLPAAPAHITDPLQRLEWARAQARKDVEAAYGKEAASAMFGDGATGPDGAAIEQQFRNQ